MKIRTRLIVLFLLPVSIGFFFLTRHILNELRPRYLEAVEEVLVDEANLMASLVEAQLNSEVIPTSQFKQAFGSLATRDIEAKIYNLKKTNVDTRVYITDQWGIVVFDSENGQAEGEDYSQWRDVYLTLRGQYGARSTRDQADNPGSSVIHVAAPIRYQEKIVGVLTVQKPNTSINKFLQSARPEILLAAILAGLVVISLGLAFSSWVTRPLQKLTRYAREVRDGKRARLPDLGRNELQEMGQAFEEMREALEGKKYVEHYVQTLTHELKSPLAAISGAAEILQGKPSADKQLIFTKNIHAETKRMQQIVERMLDLSALEAQEELKQVEKINLSELVEDLLNRNVSILTNKSLRLIKEIQPGLWVKGDKFLLEGAILNLLQNAADFSPRQGLIKVSLSPEDSQLILRMEDEGPGIPEYAQDKIFDRFYSLPRPDSKKKSSGLGLSFVKRVLELHGGRVEVTNRKTGGAESQVWLMSV